MLHVSQKGGPYRWARGCPRHMLWCFFFFTPSFNYSFLCFQGLIVAVEISSVASIGTQTSTTVPMTTKQMLPPRFVKRTQWWWLTRFREYRSEKNDTSGHNDEMCLSEIGIWVCLFWKMRWNEWLSEHWKNLIYKITTSWWWWWGRRKNRNNPVWDAWMINFLIYGFFFVFSFELVYFILISVVWFAADLSFFFLKK